MNAAVFGVSGGNITLVGMILQCIQIAGQEACYEESQRQRCNTYTTNTVPTPCISHLLSTLVKLEHEEIGRAHV
jgi:hypothetical protein